MAHPAPQPAHAREPATARPVGVYAALALVPVLLAYLTSFQGAFVFDDIRHIVNNDLIKDLSHLPEMLTERRPVVVISLAINHAIGGLNPFGYHLVNLAVHLAAVLVLFDLIRRTLLLDRFGARFVQSAAPIAAACALLWGIHPLTTQAVTYIIQRGESMASLCYLLVLYSLVRASTAKTPPNWLAVGVVACALGLSAKAIVVTAPFLALVYDRVFLSGSFIVALRKRWVFYVFLLATLSLLFANGLMQAIFATPEGAKAINNIGFGARGIHPVEYAKTQAGVIWHYLRLAILPVGQSIDDRVVFVNRLSPLVIAQGVALLAAAVAGLIGSIRGRAWGFVVLAFFVILAPTSSFIPIRDASYEHRMYLPLALVIIGLVFLLIRLVPALRTRTGVVVVALLALALGGLTARRNLDYQSRLTLWESTLAARPDNDRAMSNVAIQLIEAERYDREPDFERAADLLTRALEIRPGNTLYLRWLGIAQARSGDFTSAERSLRRALDPGFQTGREFAELGQELLNLEIEELYDVSVSAWQQATLRNPRNTDWRQGLAMAQRLSGDAAAAAVTMQEIAKVDPTNADLLLRTGRDQQEAGDTQGAIRSFRAALQSAPTRAGIAARLAQLLIDESQLDAAREVLESTLATQGAELDPDYAAAQYLLGNVANAQGDAEQAIGAYRAAIEADDQFLEPAINLADLLEKRARLPEAMEVYEQAIERVEPTEDNAALRARLVTNFGNSLVAQGRFVEAMPIYESAIDINPESIPALHGLAYSQWQAGLLEDAIETCNLVLELNPEDQLAGAYRMTIMAELATRNQQIEAQDPQ